MSISENGNLVRALQFVQSLTVKSEREQRSSSHHWFTEHSVTECSSEKLAIWANDSSVMSGCITVQLGEELSQFLEQARARQCNRIILFLDSAGVALNQGWQAMQYAARLIKQLYRLRQQSGITTIAVLGQGIGCFGGALLTASSCQYVLGSVRGQYGVSGRKVIAQMCGYEEADSRLFYQAEYRLQNQELYALAADQTDALRDQLLSLEYAPLNIAGLQEEFRQLQQSAEAAGLSGQPAEGRPKEGQPLPGFPLQHPLGCAELFSFIEQLMFYLNSGLPFPSMQGNCEQAFAFSNEQHGFSRYLAFCMKLLRYLAEQSPLHIKVTQGGCGATFIAIPMMADELEIEHDSKIFPLPQEVVDLFVPDTRLQGDEWRG